MLKFFRKIRHKLLDQNKIGNYLKYAIGEIFLVVIGILIALQVNNWNEDYKNQKRELSYLNNFQQDLEADSIRLFELKNDLEKAAHSKRVFLDFKEGRISAQDSLKYHFSNQYNIANYFTPNSTTLDELKNSGGLVLISNKTLRRQLVSLYNNYEDLSGKLKLGSEKNQLISRFVSEFTDDINNPTDEEIMMLLNNRYFINQSRLNYLYTQSEAAARAYYQCLGTLVLIRKELNKDHY
jgi:hypothetical protein